MIKICVVCGKAFFTTTSAITCSDECRQKRIVQNRNKSRGDLPEITCPICGKVFRQRRKNNKYCSNACYYASLLKTDSKRYHEVLDDKDGQYTRNYPTVVEKPKPKKKHKSQIDKILKSGETYAEHQMRQTLSLLPPIDTNIHK